MIVNAAAAPVRSSEMHPGPEAWGAFGLLVLTALLCIGFRYAVIPRCKIKKKKKDSAEDIAENKLVDPVPAGAEMQTAGVPANAEIRDDKKTKTSLGKKAGFLLWMILLSGWGGCVLLLMALKGMTFCQVLEIFSSRIALGNLTIAWTTIIGWLFVCVTAVLSLLLQRRYTAGEKHGSLENMRFIEWLVERFGENYLDRNPDSPKKVKRKLRLMTMIIIVSAWYFTGVLLNWLSGGEGGGLRVEFEMFSERTVLFGVSIANTTILTWVVIGVVLLLSLVFRFLVFPRFRERPRGLQNIMELAVEAMDSFAKNTVGEYGESLSPYMFSIAVLMVGCAATELFGQRPPTSDLLMTGTMGLITFALINYYGARKKGIWGRIRGMARPSPVIFPMKILSDVAVPVSLACRLFGNMLGGMIVMDLLKSSLGGYAVGITALAGIYFNLFHPLIQTYIFIILSMTFINEATE